MDVRRHAAGPGPWAMARENIGLKLAALFASVVLFSLVRGAGDVQRSIDLPLTVNLPTAVNGNPVLLTPLPDKVRLILRGSPSVVGSLRPEEVGLLQLDLRDGHRANARLDATLIHLPAGARFVGFSPDTLELRWDTMISRALPVRASLVGSTGLRTRVDAASVEAEPDRVRVRGPSLYVDPLTAVHTEPLDVTGFAQGRYDRRVPLETLRTELAYEGAPSGVRVTFEVKPLVADRRIEDVPVTMMGNLHVLLRPSVVDVVVRGDPLEVERLDPSQVVAVVEIPDATVLARGPASARVRVRPLPEGCEAGLVSPNEVLVVPLH